jgi:hypothetical protein
MLLNTVDALLPPPSGPGAKSTAASSSPLAEISPDVGRKFRRTRVEAWAIVEKLKREHDEAREKETTGKSKAERAEEDRLRKKKEARDALSAKERTKVRTTPVLHEEAMRLLTPSPLFPPAARGEGEAQGDAQAAEEAAKEVSLAGGDDVACHLPLPRRSQVRLRCASAGRGFHRGGGHCHRSRG